MKILFSLLLSCAIGTAFAQHDFDSLYDANPQFKAGFDAMQSSQSIFRDNAPVFHMELSADFKTLATNKDSAKYWPAQMAVHINDTVVYRTHLKVKPRGVMRRKLCNFPPLQLNFAKKDMVFSELQHFDKVKMVQSCKKGENYEEYILAEYLAYKLYNKITDMSFRTRLFKIRFHDTGGAFESEEKFAFAIEPFDELADRLDMKRVKGEYHGVLESQTNWDQAAIVDVFQYMIGNCDWAIANGHNMKLLQSKDPNDPKPYSVPYDFDYAGFVNAPYAKPPRILPISRVTERFYMGACRPQDELQKTFDLFIEKEEEIMELIQNDPHISTGIKNHLTYFTMMFYEYIEDEDYFEQFQTMCK